ncbi:methyltransferase [Aminobacter sp. AP02]|uniref:class I SAM-dependent methyltransferase n=1 Tax=Aminobacter sp. AP02 TaxID=2135737 RepID=UPI000D6C250D|nr:methyltransferase [Aminobacter sp. AP02]PWK72575.1 putative nicotinamide N-methyase [Aminobacter sp. AP02]
MNFQLSRRSARPDPAAFIAANLLITPVPSLPDVRLYTAHPASGLAQLAGNDTNDDAPPPYWAYQWAGGLVLARHILDRPETVRGRRVLDLGAGSGLVGIAAAKAGARSVLAAEIDSNGIAAIGLNAALNDVALTAACDDLTNGPPPEVDLVLVGDLFYAPDLASRVTAFLDRCVSAGIEVLVGDPGRAYLPHVRLRLVAEHAVADVGTASTATTKPSAVYSFV